MITGRRERGRAARLLLCSLLSLGVLLLGVASPVQAQERTGVITGELTDATGGVLPGVSVTRCVRAASPDAGSLNPM